MATEIQLEIVTPLKSAFSGKALQVILPAWEGQEGVLPDHDAKLALLKGGVCTVVTTEGEIRFAIGRGFAEISGERVTLLTDSCVAKADVNAATVSAQLKEVEAKLATLDWVSEEANQARIRIEALEAQLSA